MTTIEKHAKTVEQAISDGLLQLGMTADEVEIKIIKEADGENDAIVALSIKDNEAQRLQGFLDDLFQKMGISCTAYVEADDIGYVVDVVGEDTGVAIGYRGEVLDAIQYLSTIFINKGNEDYYVKIKLNAEGYREKREQTLKDLALRTAERAIKMGKNVSLEPMNAQERRIVHETLADNNAVETESMGKEPKRFVVIKLKQAPIQSIEYGTSTSFKKKGPTNTRSFGNKKR